MKLFRILSRRTIFRIVLIGFAFFLTLTFYSNPKSPVQNGLSAKQEKISIGLPVNLKIPQINVNTSIIQVGVTSKGYMDIPKKPEETAWFSLGPRPGEIGSSVINGHSGWEGGLPAIFDNLFKLKRGDRLYVEDEKGAVITFIVREVKLYDKDADTSKVFNSSDGKAHLNLITCSGDWDEIERNSSSRLVVFSDKEIK